jgi:hypothetical protein
MDAAQHGGQSEALANQNLQDEKEMKAKRKYYGKIFVSMIFFLIVYEYYIYVYQIMWAKLAST